MSIIPYRKVIGSTWETGVPEMHIIVELMFTVTIAMPDMHVAAWKEWVKKSKQENYEKNRSYRYKSDKCSQTNT